MLLMFCLILNSYLLHRGGLPVAFVFPVARFQCLFGCYYYSWVVIHLLCSLILADFGYHYSWVPEYGLQALVRLHVDYYLFGPQVGFHLLSLLLVHIPVHRA